MDNKWKEIQDRLDATYGIGICTLIDRPKYGKYSGFLVLWSNGEEQKTKEFPRKGPPSKIKDNIRKAAQRNILLAAEHNKKYRKEIGFRDREKTIKALEKAISDKAEILDIFHDRKNGRTIAYVKLKWLQTGEISTHNKDSIIKGLTFHPPSLTQEAKENTCIKRYGFKNPTMNNEIRLKAAKNTNKTYQIKHWKTGEILECQGLYEFVIAEYLNNNREEYEFQVTYTLPTGKTYTTDFVLSNSIQIEVKGYWYDEEAKDKWKLFKSIYPNAELWDTKVIKAKGLYRRYLKIWKESRNDNSKTVISS